MIQYKKAVPTTGFSKETTSQKVERLQAVIDLGHKSSYVSNTYVSNPQTIEDAKYELAHKIAVELVARGSFEKSYSASTGSETLRFEVNFVPPGITNVAVQNTYVFRLKGHKFTEDQIKEALINTFPENFA